MIRVGPAGWSYDDWQGIVYPRERSRAFHPLSHLARFVPCVEINSSFYAPPQASYARRWVKEVEDVPGFRFTAKLQDVFTHAQLGAQGSNDSELEAACHRWLEGIEPLRSSGRLSAVLVQFPVSFRDGPRARARLQAIEGRFGHLPLVLEVRHRSWFEREPLRLIESLGYSLAHIDLPAARDHPPAEFPRTGPIGYVRLHGRNAASWFDPKAGRDQRYDYLYSPAELTEIVGITRRLATGVDDTYVITNNHFSGKAVANALEMTSMLEGQAPAAPAELVRAFPRLRERVRVAGQQDMFL